MVKYNYVTGKPYCPLTERVCGIFGPDNWYTGAAFLTQQYPSREGEPGHHSTGDETTKHAGWFV